MSFLKKLFGLSERPKPVEMPPVEDSVFGHLTWRAEDRSWSGSAACDEGGKFDLQVDAPSGDEHLPSEAQRQVFLAVQSRFAELRRRGIEHFLDWFNEGVEGDPYTVEELVNEVEPGSILVEADLEVTVEFYDSPNDMMGGHSIAVHVHPDGRVEFGVEG